MLSYIVKRLLLMIPTLVVITLLSYGMMRLAPGDPTRMASGDMLGGGSGELDEGGQGPAAKAFKEYYNLDKPWYQGYWYWLTGDPKREDSKGIIPRPGFVEGSWWPTVTVDLGKSITVQRGTPVVDLLGNRMLTTIKLNLWAILLIYMIAIPVGIYSAVHQNSFFDRFLALLFFFLYSLPSFVLGMMLILGVANYGWLTEQVAGASGARAGLFALVGAAVVAWLVSLWFFLASGRGPDATPGETLRPRREASWWVMAQLCLLPLVPIVLLPLLLPVETLLSWPVGGLTPNDVPRDVSYWLILARTARHYVLPVLCLSVGGFAGLSRFARTSILEVIRQDYIRTARAKGVAERAVILKHALRNSLIPLITIFAGLLPGLIGGSMLIEYLFNIQGMGTLGLEALSKRDYPVMMVVFGLSSTLTLTGILLSDILYALADPRIKYD